jgi:hypothetical protein
VEEEVRNIESKIGAKTHVVVQNEGTKVVVEQLEAHDVVH